VEQLGLLAQRELQVHLVQQALQVHQEFLVRLELQVHQEQAVFLEQVLLEQTYLQQQQDKLHLLFLMAMS
jgi:hypothetical protein